MPGESLYRSDKTSHSKSFQYHESFMDDYTLIEKIGNGGYGCVMSAIHRVTGIHVAVKFIYKEKLSPSSLVLYRKKVVMPIEIALLSQLNHHNVIKYIDSYEDDAHYILIMEIFGNNWKSLSPSDIILSHLMQYSATVDDHYIRMNDKSMLGIRRTSCDLFECIESHTQLSESQALYIFKQVVQCVNDLSDINVYHRDIKDENILIDADYNVKLIDFGAAIQIPVNCPRDSFTLTSFHGTVSFASPEILEGLPYRPEPAEVWSLGVLLYTLLFGQVPFHSHKQAMTQPWNQPSIQRSTQSMELMDGLLRKNPNERLTLKQILYNPWLSHH
ncbi:kinase-like domain-containing protein [Pilobolus umbonatus]|nr:kinase-like domain-containing protein [Pilobolus umbonatus]